MSRINKLEELDLGSIKRSDLQVMYYTGQAISTGSGREKKYTYRQGVETPLGDIELSVWLKAAEYVVKRDGLEDELAMLRPYVISVAKATSLQRSPYEWCRLLDSCLSELYRNPAWVHFKEYNAKYHPELLEQREQ